MMKMSMHSRNRRQFFMRLQQLHIVMESNIVDRLICLIKFLFIILISKGYENQYN